MKKPEKKSCPYHNADKKPLCFFCLDVINYNQTLEKAETWYESNAYIEQLIRDGRIEIDLEKFKSILLGDYKEEDVTPNVLDGVYKIINKLNQPALLKVKDDK